MFDAYSAMIPRLMEMPLLLDSVHRACFLSCIVSGPLLGWQLDGLVSVLGSGVGI